MRHEPGEQDSSSVFAGLDFTKHAYLENKVKNAIDHGAAGMLVVTDPLNHMMINPRGFPWPSLSKMIPEDALPMYLKNEDIKKIPVVHVGKEVMNMVYGSVDSLKNIQAQIDRNMKPLSMPFPGIEIRIKTTVTDNPVKNSNIIGILPGTDPELKNEYLIIGAHYDHVGYLKEYNPGEDYIINGADDNASGTAGLLSIAEAFFKAERQNRQKYSFYCIFG
ncbi:MAG: M28 family peptidase [Bacteroidetes bacterium]|nr:M28 family peptidase [Bacteroidota bacterium]